MKSLANRPVGGKQETFDGHRPARHATQGIVPGGRLRVGPRALHVQRPRPADPTGAALYARRNHRLARPAQRRRRNHRSRIGGQLHAE